MTGRAWTERAACADADPELFFPLPSDSTGWRQVAEVYCRRCPVKAECLAYALEKGEERGVWGGTSAKQRQRMRRRLLQRRAAS